MIAPAGAAFRLDGVTKTFRRETGESVTALDGISFSVAPGELAALVGPDGAGKTTLLRLAAGLIRADRGTVSVLGLDSARQSQQVQERIAYMPQRFGLYEDLTVKENLDLYAALHGVTAEERRRQYPRLMAMTALEPFVGRLAGRLSGGMKQKLGLACTLIRSPELLLLDEPTVGVDPLSRRELWDIIRRLVGEGLTVVLSSSYLDEAEECRRVLVLREGKSLADATPAEVRRRAEGRTFLATPPAGTSASQYQAQMLGQPQIIDAVPEGGKVRLVTRAESGLGRSAEAVPPRFEDGFMIMLHGEGRARPTEGVPAAQASSAPAVEVRDLVRRFGNFTAVDHVNFTVRRGEIYGLLGPNGAGKTTTFRMLCGLIEASSGSLTVAGIDVRKARADARQRLGYVAQKFSLYGQLTVAENLDFFAQAYGLSGSAKQQRIERTMSQFELASLARLPSAQLPGGFKQRLAMAAALLHDPEILFLDEPTSGADPLARREFWRRITALAATGVTVIVTTHFMPEAEYCDRAAILAGGRLLAEGTPAELRAHARPVEGRTPTMEDAFIAIVNEGGDASSRRPSAPGAPP